MGLTELWIELGDTADSPHIIQGKDSRISPVEYYTDANYDYLYKKWWNTFFNTKIVSINLIRDILFVNNLILELQKIKIQPCESTAALEALSVLYR